MTSLGSKGQGESLIKLLVVAIIAVIALALAKSYFRESSRVTQMTVEEIFAPDQTETSSQSVAPTFNPNFISGIT